MQTIGSFFHIAAVRLNARPIAVNRPDRIRAAFKAAVRKDVFRADSQSADCLIFLFIQDNHTGDPVISRTVFLCRLDLFRIPGYFPFGRSSVRICYRHFFRKADLFSQGSFCSCRFYNADLKFCGRTCFYIFKYIQCIQRMSGEIKQSLIVYCGTAIPFSGILGIVFSRIGCCPAGAVLFPCCAVVLQYFLCIICVGIVDLYRKPCGFPVEYADAVGRICDGIDNLSQFLCLTIDTEIIRHIRVIIAVSYGIVMAVTVFQSCCPGGLRHHNFLPVGRCNSIQLIL